MLSRMPYTRNEEEEVAVEVVEGGEETIVVAEEAVTSGLRCGAAGVARTPTISKIAGRRTVTATNRHAAAIRKPDSRAMDVEK